MKNNRGFSLVELLVVMSIIAVLMSMATYGISIMNRNSRDAQRTKVINEIKLGIEQYYIKNGKYPPISDLIYDSAGNKVKVCYNESSNCTTNFYSVELKGLSLSPSNTSTKAETAYCYSPMTGAKYILGVLSESGGWKNIGTDSSKCTGTPAQLIFQ